MIYGMNTYPFDKDRRQVNPGRCPAPFCGASTLPDAWFTPVLFESDRRYSFADPDPDLRCVAYKMCTCASEPCREWAWLRASDIGCSQRADLERVAVFRWRYCPEVPRELGGNGRREGNGNIWLDRDVLDRYRKDRGLPPIDWDKAVI